MRIGSTSFQLSPTRDRPTFLDMTYNKQDVECGSSEEWEKKVGCYAATGPRDPYLRAGQRVGVSELNRWSKNWGLGTL